MKKVAKIFFTFTILLLSFTFFCQRPLNNYFSEFSGLPGSNVYSVMQDKEGYLWFSTSKGVSRYDGYEFNSFTTSDGLTDNEVLGTYQDNENRIWFRTFNGRPCFFLEGHIYNAGNCSLLRDVELTDLIAAIFQDEDGQIWIGSKNEIITISPKGGVPKRCNMRSQFFWEDQEGLKSFPGSDRFYNHSTNSEVEQNIDLDSLPVRVPELLTELGNGDFLVSKNTMLFLVTGMGRQYTFLKDVSEDSCTQILSVFEDSKKQIWIGSRSGLIRYPGVTRLNEPSVSYLNDCEVNGITEDHEGSIWVATSTGVYQFESERMVEIESGRGDVTALAISGNEMTVGYKSGQIQVYYFDTISNLFSLKKNISTDFYAREIKYFDNTAFISSDVGLFLQKGEGLTSTSISYSVKGFDYSASQLVSGTSYGAYSWKLPNVNLGNNSSNSINTKFFNERVYHIMRVDEQLFLTTKNKVYSYDGVLHELNYFDEIIPHKISSISQFEDQLVVGTENNGLYFLKNEKVAGNYNREQGLASNDVINTFEFDKTIYAVTSQGISYLAANRFVLLPETNSARFKIRAVQVFNHSIVIGTSMGLTVLNLDLPQDYITNPLVVLNVSSEGSSSEELSRDVVLEHDTNNLKFEFKRISFHASDFTYRYRILGLNEDWNETKERAVAYKNIPPGDYTFELDYGGSSFERFHFTILKPFWQTTAFILSSGILLIVLIVFSYVFLLRRYKRKSMQEFAIKLSIAEAEQKALRAQMNPHFIFNALNAIQNFVLKKDTEKAYEYLGQFAKLIRATLHNSRKMTNTIKEELEFLKLYLNLESLRFKDQFEYDFIVDKKVDLELMIPSMVIQPFVENAIIHGLLPAKKDSVRRLVIRITSDDDFTYYEIEDNGVGIAQSTSKPDRKQVAVNKSYGIQITRERILLFDPSGDSMFTTENLMKEGDSETGTIVRLKIKRNVQSSNH